MDQQEDTMDFKAIRAKFQDELLKQPKIKPALPEKPKVVPPPQSPTHYLPPPQSPTHYLPAGARPSLLTSINQTLDGMAMAPRVVFKEDKKESKKPLIQTNTKGKDKSEGKLKKTKDKTTKGSKEKLDEDPPDQKQKKEKKLPLVLPVAPKEATAELVAATPPPKATAPKKKGFLGFRKSSTRVSVKAPADPILDRSSSDVPGPAPLIPVPADFTDAPPEPELIAPKALLPNIPTSPDSSAAGETTLPFSIPASPDFTPPPAFIPDIPAPKGPTLEGETPPEMETPALPVSRPASHNEFIHSPPSAVPTPPPSRAVPAPPPRASTPAPPPRASTPPPSPPDSEPAAEAGVEAVHVSAVEKPPPPVTDASSTPPSPKAERPITALSALSRAEDMSPVRRTSPCDQRIFHALEKARRKTTSQLKPADASPPPEERPPSQSPTSSLPELPPIDYEDRARKALPPQPEQVNGFDHRQASPVLVGITEEGSDPVPELLVVPPPPPRKVLPDPESLGPAPEKPDRPPSAHLSDFIPPPPPPVEEEMSAPPEFSETDGPEFDEVASGAQSPELPVSDWGNEEYAVPKGQKLLEFYGNGITPPGAEVHAAPAAGDQNGPLPEPSVPVPQVSPPPTGIQAGLGNGVCEGSDNVYEDVAMSATKKRGKTDGGKKRKGPPKNPYAEAAQETNEEKNKTGRFSKSDKKAAAEGPDEKELKKKEKQRLEKEKKELKEKQEREKKEQKEREKKENEMKKKFKITGQEDAMYEAKVTVTTKGRKNDLPVKSGDIISIIRTTSCPKGKWLARDSSSNYGYVAVDHVELDIKEMLELGKKAAITRSSNVTEAEVTSTGSRASNHYPLSAESFTDDSEEWTADDEELLSPASEPADPLAPMGHTRTLSMPDMGNKDPSVNHQHSHSDISAEGSHVQARHEALQKLATFFYSPKPEDAAASSSTELETSAVTEEEEAVQPPEAAATQETDFDQMLILPPPDLYADLTVE